MEIRVIEESKNKIVFELKGENHTFCNALKDMLLNEKEVSIASYKIEHPLIGEPEFIIETKGKEPKKVLEIAAKNLQKELASFRKAF
ncbi:DNA-directed RNA polymerase subunit L [Candidatus Woesearchaeota archaeon]|nr:DNA-directed RNA polymerase subunit L [Candidatus Woesearchaeota archaeon]